MLQYKDHPIFDTYDYVAGVDPGGITGVSTFDRFGLQDTSCHVALASKDGIETRNLGLAYSVMSEIIGSALVVIEMNHVYSMSRAGAALSQRELIGVIAGLAHKYGHPIMRVSPAEGKKALTGNGRAKKPEMVEAARLEFPGIMEELSAVPKREAVADSIGIALSGMVKWEQDAQ